MILTEKVKIKINNRYVKYYKNLGYNIKGRDEIEISVDDLPKQSHIEVKCECDNCKAITTIKYYNYMNNIKKQNIYLCKKCKHIKTEKTNIELYGVKSTLQSKEVLEQIEQHNIDNYGVDHYSKTVEFKEKIKKKNNDKYNVDWYFQSDEYKKIKKDIFIKKYNVEYYSQTEEFNQKRIETTTEKYGVEHYSKTKEFKQKIVNNTLKKYLYKNIKIIDYTNEEYTILCKRGHNFSISKSLLKNRLRFNVEPCIICNPIHSHSSDKENKLLNYIKDNYDGKIINSDRNILSGKELDIYLPDLKLAFEFNGVYWHNELNRENNYHLNKTEKCLEKEIQLIHIWEDDWIYKEDIVKSMILNKLKKTNNSIYARKTELREITDNKLIRNFLDNNHIQGFVGSKIKIGLYYNNELVSLITFGKKRIAMNSNSKNNNEYELLRFCNKLNTNVIGGASKLFKYFIKIFNPSEIITYADRSHSQGKLYEILGFNFIHKTSSNYYYVIGGIRKHRFNYRKDALVKQGYDKNMTEHEIMLIRKIYRIHDSGSLKYKKDF